MPKYRKKSIIIEANQLTFSNGPNLADWCNGDWHESNFYDSYLTITTLEGIMRADIGDFIIKGIKGEFYPCKPDIFKNLHDEIIDNES